jgi:FkbM family methyltransferase
MIDLNGIKIKTDFPCISEYMKSRLNEGRYEIAETKLIPEMLRNGDSVLEIGGGIGYLSSLVSRTGNCSDLVVIEANPDLIPVIHENHLLNGVSAQVFHGVPKSNDSHADCDFYMSEDFWESSTVSSGGESIKSIKVPCIDIQKVIIQKKITFLICDIEGDEQHLFSWLNLSGIRAVVVEVHPEKIGKEGVEKVKKMIVQQGFVLSNSWGQKLFFFERSNSM